MNDFYTILARHFLNETNKIEEKRVFDYKTANPKEYNLLKRLWESEEVQVDEFDSSKAWNEFMIKVNKRRKYSLPLYWNFAKVAAAIAFLIISTFLLIYTIKSFRTIEIENTSLSPKLVSLSDGSKVWLNSNSSIKYDKNFVAENREIQLIGTGFFEVAHDTLHPFVVTSENTSTTVLGTSFNISNQNSETIITVKTGRVLVELEESNKEVVLIANQSVVASDENLITNNVIDKNFQSWMTGIFEFDSTPINKVIADLNTFYKNIELSNTNNKCFLTAKFNNAKFKDVLETLSATCNLEVEQVNGKVILR